MHPGSQTNIGAAGGGGGPAPTYTFNGSPSVSGSNLSSYTFPGVDLGAAGTKLVVISGYSTNEGISGITSATINGVAATIIDQITVNSSTDGCAFIVAAVVLAATGNVVLNFGSSQSRCGINSYAIFDLASTTKQDSNTASTDGGALDVNTSVNSIVIGVSGQVGNGGTTWAGLATEDHDNTAIEVSVRFHGASEQVSSASTPRTINSTAGVGSFHAAACASFV